MSEFQPPESRQKILALWIAVIVEAFMIIAMGSYNIYEVRRTSQLVQNKIEGLAEYSAHQGEKLDRMMTALELYVGKKIATEDKPSPQDRTVDERIQQAIDFLENWKKKGESAESPEEVLPDGQES